MIIHVEWSGPHSFADVKSLTADWDCGVYQIYGGHPVYGSRTLLYIGQADGQSFGTRIPQHKRFLDNRDSDQLQAYVGRLSCGGLTPSDDLWHQQIQLTERLLIFAHSPTLNTQKNLGSLSEDLRDVHVLNWGQHADLMPEVSGARWSDRFAEIPDYHAYGEDEEYKNRTDS